MHRTQFTSRPCPFANEGANVVNILILLSVVKQRTGASVYSWWLHEDGHERGHETGQMSLDRVMVAAVFAVALVRVIGPGLRLRCELVTLCACAVRARRSAFLYRPPWKIIK